MDDSQAEKGKLQKRVDELSQEVTCLRAEREKGAVLFQKVKGPSRSQGGRLLIFHEGLKKAILRCLSRGLEATAIRRTLVYLVEEMGLDSPQVPSLPAVNNWRSNDLPVHLQTQLEQFVESATTLSLSMDCSALRDHKVSGLGLIDDRQQYLLMDLCASNNSNSDELYTQVRKRLQESGVQDQIVAKTVDIITGKLVIT